MDAYYQRRPTIGIPASSVLTLDGTMGLHPSLTGLYQLYQSGKLAIVQGLGYPNPNRSHFRATDIWMTGTSAEVVEGTGWMGRDLLYRNPEYPGVLTPAPLALQVGGSPALALRSSAGDMGVTITDPNEFYQLITGTVGLVDDPPPKTPAGRELRYLRTIAQEAIQYATVIKTAADRASNLAPYPDTELAAQLAIVARLIAGGLGCPIYMVSQGGYDTHSSQLSRQTTLFTELGGAITAFQQDLDLLGVAQNVAGMTFTEFGRRTTENGSAGTDHGSSSAQFVFGSRVAGGLHGPPPDFTALDPVGDFLFTTDYRRLYATMLGSWFGGSDAQISSVLFGTFPQLPLFQLPKRADGSAPVPAVLALHQNHPNPFNPSTTITVDLPVEAPLLIEIVDAGGRRVRELARGTRSAGTHRFTFDATGLASGAYLCRLVAGGTVLTRKMLLVR
jgi:uncharacterized protein (DUF1501 family)